MANVNETVQGLLKGMEGFVTTKSVVGQAITMEDGTVLLPLVDVTFGVAAGAFNKDSKRDDDSKSKKLSDRVAGGLGGKMSPFAILVIKDGNTRLITVKDNDTLTRIVDMACSHFIWESFFYRSCATHKHTLVMTKTHFKTIIF